MMGARLGWSLFLIFIEARIAGRVGQIRSKGSDEPHILVRTILPPHEPNDVPAQTILPHHEPHEILVRTILPHPCPLPLGEGELSPDGVVRRMITKVQGFNARMFRGNLTPALSRPPSAVSLLRGCPQGGAVCRPENESLCAVLRRTGRERENRRPKRSLESAELKTGCFCCIVRGASMAVRRAAP